MEPSDLQLIDQVYAVTTREGSLKDAAHTFLVQQNELAGAIVHYDPHKHIVKKIEPVARNPDHEPLIQGLLELYMTEAGPLQHPLIEAGYDNIGKGELVISDDTLPYPSFKQTAYFQAVLAPLGVRRTMAWVAWGSEQSWQVFISSRDSLAGEYGESELARVKLFKRHFARAIYTLELLGNAHCSKRFFEQAINQVPQAMVAVDEQLNVLFCNPTAENLLRNYSTVSIKSNKLNFGSDSNEKAKFNHWWKLLTQTGLTDSAKFNPIDGKKLWEIEASRISTTPRAGIPRRHWLLTLKPNPSRGEKPISYLINRYGLSESEAKVCFALCDTGDAVSIAQSLGITPNTARTHLKHIFKKTGYKNQVQLAVNITAETS
ncbi:helix-turn-helix transcriptional regulator [Gilvimarinus xylanilyticus]|uniref:Helix-turn-helix transcriptional regulator n=1 Tax=Gilvimarinus xylanilyticus TaxID=2944139 RepID=A0A9X2I4A4_9GAMM|nr:LuxR C-terminal-related transcriptional regulator [Gilvimarinus xylanilyticus]MCP8898667.1 helix-turn-helix transcriptional regulator [Gilvimarinus xylanilyticus]